MRAARLESTVDAQALTEVSRVHADLNRIGGLLKLAIRGGVSDPSSQSRLKLEVLDSIIQLRRAVGRLAQGLRRLPGNNYVCPKPLGGPTLSLC